MQQPTLAGDYQDLLPAANVTYQALVHSGKWLSFPPDNMVLMTLMAKVDQLQCLVQKKELNKPQQQRKGKCFTCGKEDHWAHDCPKKQQGEGNKVKKNLLSWKKVALKQNELEKKLKIGQLWKGCTRCSHWLLVHSTMEHKGPTKQKNLKGHTTDFDQEDTNDTTCDESLQLQLSTLVPDYALHTSSIGF